MPTLDPLELPLQGTHLIEASAGTGKTYTIASLFVRLVLERDIPIDRVLVVTFTEAASAELRDRIRRRLRETLEAFEDPTGCDPLLRALVQRRAGRAEHDVQRLQLALRSFDEAMISTIHGFCHRVLHDRAFETGVAFDAELLVDPSPLLDEIVRDFWARELYEGDPLFVAYLNRQNVTPRRLVALARRSTMHPDLPVLPADVDRGAQLDLASFLAAYDTARTLWQRHRAEIVDLLTQHPGLHANRYPAAALPQWFKAMDVFLRDPTPGPALGFEHLEKFSASTLRQYTKKDYLARVPQHPFFDACEALVEARQPLLAAFDQRLVALKRNLIEFVRKELPRRKRRAGQQSFDDLLVDLDRALRRRKVGKDLAAAVRQRYQAALIDEFQDTDPVQYRIFRAIYGGSDAPLYLIGDPKQAIYGFRGADIFAYLDAAQSVRARHKHTMDTNWRSDPALLAALQVLFSVPRPFFLEAIDFIPVRPRPGAEPVLWRGEDPLPAFELRVQTRKAAGVEPTKGIPAEWSDAEIPQIVARDIARALSDGTRVKSGSGTRPLRAGDIAVLVRKNAQAQQVQAALRRRGIPSVVYGDASVLATAECRELLRVLAAVAEPTHNGLLRAAITTELIGVTATELFAMQEDDQGWNRWIEVFRRWHRLWVERGFIQMFRALLVDTDASRRLLALRDGERRMTNLLHLAELLHRAAVTEHLGPAGLLRWLGEARDEGGLYADALKLRLESDDLAVQLITIHRSKGLEFPVVYCPYLWAPDELHREEEEDLLFHDPNERFRLTLDIRSKPIERKKRLALPEMKQARYEHAAENLRLLYVALTRARHRCVVYWGMFDRAPQSALAYLLFSKVNQTSWVWDPELVVGPARSLDDEAMLAHLRSRGDEHWSISLVADEGEPERPAAAPVATPELAARACRRRLDRSFRSSSFTEMTSSHRAASLLERSDGRDHDQVTLLQEPRAEKSHTTRVQLADFPRGAKAGNFFHEVLEHLDFDAPAPRRRALLSARLRTYGYDEATWLDRLDVAFEALLRAPLAPGGPALADIPRTARHSELAFVFPVGPRDEPERLHRIALAQVFATHGEGLPPGYAERVARLGFAPLRGFLNGFIDLVFRHDGRWYVADYKSNHLGVEPGDYGREALREVMAVEHYILQYHLYVLAVVRHLRQRVPSFDYERDFGGVYYLFLRGMTDARAPGEGVYDERPPEARILALDALFTMGRS